MIGGTGATSDVIGGIPRIFKGFNEGQNNFPTAKLRILKGFSKSYYKYISFGSFDTGIPTCFPDWKVIWWQKSSLNLGPVLRLNEKRWQFCTSRSVKTCPPNTIDALSVDGENYTHRYKIDIPLDLSYTLSLFDWNSINFGQMSLSTIQVPTTTAISVSVARLLHWTCRAIQ